MHLIVDIRDVPPIITRYARDWVGLWRAHHPGDTLSYLTTRGQSAPSDIRRVDITPSSWGYKKPLALPGVREIFRCVNFSAYPPYDSRIKTLSHIFDNLDLLYPQEVSYWTRRRTREQKKKLITHSESVIVPHLQFGQELVEALSISESKFVVLPYIELQKEKTKSNFLNDLGIEKPYWLYDGTYGSEMHLSPLLAGYKQYRANGGTYDLVLLGDISRDDTLKGITGIIRAMDLTGPVKLIGSPEWNLVDIFYENASGWIYTGAYYGGGPRIALAESYGLPLLLSDIASLSQYEAVSVHPHHLGDLAHSFHTLEKREITPSHNEQGIAIFRQYERLLSEL